MNPCFWRFLRHSSYGAVSRADCYSYRSCSLWDSKLKLMNLWYRASWLMQETDSNLKSIYDDKDSFCLNPRNEASVLTQSTNLQSRPGREPTKEEERKGDGGMQTQPQPESSGREETGTGNKGVSISSKYKKMMTTESKLQNELMPCDSATLC